ncbi:MAG TPA: TonB-dependent receptor [Kofleriaceae bacterium]|nr:TonB-dependent receptor [Kofleriaceae bacterium]
MRPALGIALLVASVASADTVRGTVVDKATRAPVAGAIVSVGDQLAATDDDGTFVLELPRGAHVLEVSAPWLVTLHERIAVDGDVAIVFETASSDGETIEVIDVAPTQIGETAVDAKLARAVPGGGDAGKVVQSLPAVARPPAGSAEIVVWGAAPRDTRVFVDGVPVPALYHVGGYRAALGNDLLGDIRLTPAAFGPDRGRAIGGVIDIGMADPAAAPAWRAQVDPLDATVAGGTTLGPLAIALALRKSWLDRAIDAIADPGTLAPNAPLPRWSDGQLTVRAALTDEVRVTGWVLGALDALDRVLASDDPATETAQRTDRRFMRAQVTLRRETSRGNEHATLWFGRDRNVDELAVGLVTAARAQRSWVGGARAVQEARHGRFTLTTGADVDTERTAYTRRGSLAIPAREGDPQIFGQPPGDDVNADAWTATTIDAAGHAAIDVHAGPLTATLGARVDGWLLDASRLTPRVGSTPGIASQQIMLTTDPRGSVQLRVADGAALRVDGGRYHQARDASDASAVFGTPDLGLERAWHVTAGGQLARAPFAVEVAGYARWLEDLVARDPAVTPMLARVLTHDGTGRVFGVQLTARVVAWRGLSGWLSYGLSRSTRRDAPGMPRRFFDRDQTHGAIAVGGWTRGPWNVGARVRVATGEPRTGVVGAFFDSRSGRYQPIRGPHNGERLPMYFAADVRGERRFALGDVAAAVYAEVQNLTGRANAEEIIYSADFATQSYVTSLPLLAIVGLRVER